MRSKYSIVMLIVALFTTSLAVLSIQGLNNNSFSWAYAKGSHGTAINGNFNGNSCTGKPAHGDNGNAVAGEGGTAIGGSFNGNNGNCCNGKIPCSGGNAHGENGNAFAGGNGNAIGGTGNGNTAAGSN